MARQFRRLLRPASAAGANIVVVRDSSPPDQGLDAYIDAQREIFAN